MKYLSTNSSSINFENIVFSLLIFVISIIIPFITIVMNHNLWLIFHILRLTYSMIILSPHNFHWRVKKAFLIEQFGELFKIFQCSCRKKSLKWFGWFSFPITTCTTHSICFHDKISIIVIAIVVVFDFILSKNKMLKATISIPRWQFGWVTTTWKMMRTQRKERNKKCQ